MANRLIRLSTEQGGQCFYCARPVPSELETIDHVMPLKSGRQWRHFRNEVMACLPCNNKKGHREPSETELNRLMVLKRHYADVDYQIELIEPSPQTKWLSQFGEKDKQ